ncbi:8812_t:CDS:2, partial [Gigaspora margarita]
NSEIQSSSFNQEVLINEIDNMRLRYSNFVSYWFQNWALNEISNDQDTLAVQFSESIKTM